ncbi:hypothetical protein U1Q18_021206 [Sarracenia purpurea var. burkii]
MGEEIVPTLPTPNNVLNFLTPFQLTSLNLPNPLLLQQLIMQDPQMGGENIDWVRSLLLTGSFTNGDQMGPPPQPPPLPLPNVASLTSSINVSGGSGGGGSGNCGKTKGKTSHRTKKANVPPRIAFHTKSSEDVLDDGYRWRKYGQKAVKNCFHPRSYYRCTHHTCNVKKQIQRLSKDTSIVVTTYEGIHNHPCEKLMETLGPLLKQIQFLSRF